MQVIRKPERMQRLMAAAREKKKIGFVPTMGALHEGHLSLVRAARKENDIVCVSIFVNPLQFGPKEDLKKYPRPEKDDLTLLKKEKVDFLFYPSAGDMYPEEFQTEISVGEDGRASSLTAGLCGKFRPGHFTGVATVVSKLFNIVLPHRSYFGAKDYQQAMVIRRMVRDLYIPVEIKVLPTVREKDGLAMSSRNRYLSADERARAAHLFRVLSNLREKIGLGRRDFGRLIRGSRRELSRYFERVQYLEILDAATLEKPGPLTKSFALAAACCIGQTRIIDNVIIHIPVRGKSSKQTKK